ncbi:PREDICTED: transmembrane protein 164 [Bactrocera latifrons]|uniref:Transmembrane protein 164 n=1 Tax=Bactrocera latifrons TaxID=174628 RepID=A0A0K8VKP8_BACLA|nr:PREDICTED: transmembrane protein 164 [Bactrocera latifrons]XP_018787759.1 PREDICTED: transmembrane protein 164 [Bactrocera latifrons]XP_018787760.1 PREDICTED: transmembrane protein 164 [Bactrocera latifrons]XP_018787762.1 PREDICTED: transmembrane protein 164 [Bactrocera latifrons]XP_018787763.1 PREDICTED: transmembrane protein 164 [Bactrocera latifrons]XP_018787764.1 PREDICTED: transmembrane protein 164 [Bactrocera latifrons]
MDWSWAIAGVNDEIPRTAGLECINYMTNRRRWIESTILSAIFIYLICWAARRMDPIIMPPLKEINKPHSAIRLTLMLLMTFIFGVEMGFKFANKNMIYVLNPCHIQTLVQIYLLAAKPSKTTIALFRIQMNNLNGPFLAFLFPEVECRTLYFEQATYWIQHALLYIIPAYILRSGAYQIEDLYDYNWTTIGTATMLLYHFAFLTPISMFTGINLSHMLCAALSDPFQGQNYRIAATIHEIFLCPILNKTTVLIFSKPIVMSNVKRLRPKFELPLDKSTKSDRRLSTDNPLLTTRGTNTQVQLSKSVPTTPTSFAPTTNSSPISEISLVAEMAAAVAAGSGPVTMMRRMKRNSINLLTSEIVSVGQQRNDTYNNADELVNGEYTCVTTATKID